MDPKPDPPACLVLSAKRIVQIQRANGRLSPWLERCRQRGRRPLLHSLSFVPETAVLARSVQLGSGSAAAITGRCVVKSQVTVGEHRYVLTQGSDDICAASAVEDPRPSIREGSEGRRKPTKSSPSLQIPTSSILPLTETFRAGRRPPSLNGPLRSASRWENTAGA